MRPDFSRAARPGSAVITDASSVVRHAGTTRLALSHEDDRRAGEFVSWESCAGLSANLRQTRARNKFSLQKPS